MNKTKIEWTDFSWNPIKGICPVGCWYCYGRRMYQRFGWNSNLMLKKHETINPGDVSKSSQIFVCSTMEIFHPTIPKYYRDFIFNVIEDCPQHTFQILTKFPQNIDRDMPDNVWLGITVTGSDGYFDRINLDVFQDIKAKIKFISYEPVLSEVGFEEKDKIDWLIIGALTGYSYKNRRRPHFIYLQRLIEGYQKDGTKIFLKNNLKKIWNQPLIQEFPD